MKKEEFIQELESLRRHHDYCEDSWYSCPKAEDGCGDPEKAGDECNCGADKHNAILDRMIKSIKEDSACPLCGSAIL